MLNAYADYKNEILCGLLFKAVYVDKFCEMPVSDAVNRGNWFEYICTGTVNRDGSIPEPERTARGELTADYKRIEQQKENFKKIYEHMEFSSNITIEQVVDGQNYKAVFDILEYDGTNPECEVPIAIRDLKMTSVIDDKWSDYGWVNITFKKHINQAKFYIWLYWKRSGIILPFHFDVFSSKNEKEFKMFLVTMTETSLIEFETYLYETVEMIKLDIETGFIAYPDLMPCSGCPVQNDCKRYTDMPKLEHIKL